MSYISLNFSCANLVVLQTIAVSITIDGLINKAFITDHLRKVMHHPGGGGGGHACAIFVIDSVLENCLSLYQFNINRMETKWQATVA